VPDVAEDDAEFQWTAVLDSAHHRRKALGRAKRVNLAKESEQARAAAGQGRRKSGCLAAKESEKFVDMTTKAVKLRELKDDLKGCSSHLQAHVGKNKLLTKLAPMGKKTVAALRAAAFGSSTPVPVPADD
jgi:hypothetical protein